MAQGQFLANTTTKDGSQVRIKLASEANTRYRAIHALSAVSVTQGERDAPQVNSLFSGTFTAPGTPGQVTGTIDLYLTAGSPGQRLLRQAHDASAKVNIEETLLGTLAGDSDTDLVSGDGIGITAPTASTPFGVIDVSANNAKTNALRGAVNGQRGVMLKIGAAYFFVEDLAYGSGGAVTALRISPGGTEGIGSYWNNAAVTAFTGAWAVYGPMNTEKTYTGIVTAVPIADYSADATGGVNTATASFTFDGLPVEAVSDST